MNIENEVWKPVEGYEGLYEVSNLGRVRSLNFNHTGQIRVFKPTTDSYGYLHVGLYKNGKPKTFKVHRLVASAFIENPGNLEQVNHKDEDKTNNRVENLEWCDSRYNINYGTRNSRVSKAQSKHVLQFTKNGEFVKEWQSTIECEMHGFNHRPVSACCLGKRRFHKNFRWFYKDDLVYFF